MMTDLEIDFYVLMPVCLINDLIIDIYSRPQHKIELDWHLTDR